MRALQESIASGPLDEPNTIELVVAGLRLNRLRALKSTSRAWRTAVCHVINSPAWQRDSANAAALVDAFRS
eukprot:5693174-Prymnesium_polylepis.2